METLSLRGRIRARRHPSCDDGQSILEFALCVPVLLLIVTGITTFGVALSNYLTMTNAVGTAAQYLAVQRSVTTNPCSDAANAFVNAAPNLNTANLTFSFSLNGTSYGPYTGLSKSTCSSSSTSTGAAGNLVAGGSAQMTVYYPCNLAVYGHNFLPNCNLAVQTTEIVQ
ncbi:TadE/TadG family type IV pilus assembly protein [Alloacidobacterium sp.]|uniref:TadE/TadG family type IV pilus assembly protein n=1 Tax=Alloacidobacterium sp. TaxID=2951999 RepID=UPI002D4E3A37|nr:TadE/TadG family type IV pilus assembly protein [Alloacidobacterium sp.]HYK36133.1 TadE/TadG family type IV pilus assembly protein [Alloacidobacterium sp.]